MRRGKKGIAVLLFAIVGFSQSGCLIAMALLGGGTRLVGGRGPGSETRAPFTPTVKLPESPKTIEAKARLEPFVSRIPVADRDLNRADDEVTDSMAGEQLTKLVQQAILADFRSNLVFADVRVQEERPELLIRGVIHEFAERHTRPWYGKLPVVGNLIGAGEQVEGGVELDLILSKPTGELIGTYRGRSIFRQANDADSEKEKAGRLLAPGERLNRAFSEAVHQIRQQMLADQRLVDGDWRKKVDVPATGFGTRAPAASNQSEEGRQQNRRVEVVIEN
jgi:hypothetical protein